MALTVNVKNNEQVASTFMEQLATVTEAVDSFIDAAGKYYSLMTSEGGSAQIELAEEIKKNATSFQNLIEYVDQTCKGIFTKVDKNNRFLAVYNKHIAEMREKLNKMSKQSEGIKG